MQTVDYKNKGLESPAEIMRLSILGKDSNVKDTKPLEVVDAYIREIWLPHFAAAFSNASFCSSVAINS